jgi:hypothetical protein
MRAGHLGSLIPCWRLAEFLRQFPHGLDDAFSPSTISREVRRNAVISGGNPDVIVDKKRSSPERAVDLRLSKICGCLGQDLIGLPQLADFTFQRLELSATSVGTPARLALSTAAFLTHSCSVCGT